MKKALLLVSLVLLSASPAAARILRVPVQYPTIQAAMTAAVSGDVVEVAAGVYDDATHPCTPTDTTKTVVIMKSGVTLRGEGRRATIIDAGHRGRGIYCEGLTSGIIENMTIRNAYAAVYGAAIYVYNGSTVTIRGVEMTGNYDGAIIARLSSTPTIQSCWITNNQNKEGGGIFMDIQCGGLISGCFITGNKAPGGGGLYIRGSQPTIENCIVAADSVSVVAGNGGGITIESSTVSMNSCIVDGCVATAAGGGLWIADSVVQMNDCTVTNNVTTSSYGPGGGIMAEFNTDLTLTDCLIAGNEVFGNEPDSDGGGLRAVFATQLSLTRCTVAANSVAGALGAGISAKYCTPTVDRCIIAYNGPGAGLYCQPDMDAAFTVGCTDLFGNTGGDQICGTDAGDNFSLNPLFCDHPAGNYYLQAASPCAPGQHPNGPSACGGSLLGALGTGCAPLDAGEAEPVRLALESRPNPVRRTAEIGFALPREARATLRLFDLAGREIRTLLDRTLPAGPHHATWDGRDAIGRTLPSGVYFYQLSVDGRQETRRVIVAR